MDVSQSCGVSSICTNSSRSLCELPPSATAAAAAKRPSSAARSLTVCPSFPTAAAIAAAIVPASGTASAPSATGTATPASASSRASVNWSALIGHASMATPAAAASSTEFQPQCVRNQPTARWRSTSTCGAHPRITSPREDVPASNPSGTAVPALAAHTNAAELRASASATDAACAGDSACCVPKLTYTTEPSGNASSHADTSAAATAGFPPRSPPDVDVAAPAASDSGPTANTRFDARSGSGRVT
ncbi:hypothetical protein BDA96_07G239000 [Sorghum bicolor]|uniref:Uncharacterized protein n=1 Tax=Sorghum bicolor TaxID=4558 RepID=A0A921UBK7_SORBI|nr:hypothetical protein BDA96_07G239000 [Sorghum bicolor]